MSGRGVFPYGKQPLKSGRRACPLSLFAAGKCFSFLCRFGGGTETIMNIKDLFPEGEKPLDRLLPDGGFVGIFRTMGFIGDSLASGEFEATAANGGKTYHDMYEYSWGQYVGRIAGLTARNFSRGGMTAHEMAESYYVPCRLYERSHLCQGYVMALGVNDISQIIVGSGELGELSDIDPKNCENNKKTFIGYYASLLQRVRASAPDSIFFLMTIPRGENPAAGQVSPAEKFGDVDALTLRERLGDRHRELLFGLADMFPNVYVLDFRTYAPVCDEEYLRLFFYGHMSECGYLLTAKMVVSYIDYLIRHNMRAFKQTALIGTPYRNTTDAV